MFSNEGVFIVVEDREKSKFMLFIEFMIILGFVEIYFIELWVTFEHLFLYFSIMRSVNKVLLMGHLATQPEMKMTQAGHTVTTFRVATNRDWSTKDGETRPNPDFHKIVAWRKLGEACGEYLKKGSGVYIEGHISNHHFQDKEGKNRKSTEIIADVVNFISIKKTKGSEEVTLVDVPA